MGSSLSGVLGTNNAIPVVPQETLQKRNFNAEINSGINNQAQSLQQQQGLANQLQLQSQGKGPNPALAQLQNTTQQNAAESAGNYAQNRSINAGLAARSASDLQSRANQQAGGQAAVMTANQQLASQNQLQNLYGQMGSQNLQGQQISQQGQTAQNNAFNNSNQVNANIAGANQTQAGGITGGLLGGLGTIGAGVLGGGSKATTDPGATESISSVGTDAGSSAAPSAGEALASVPEFKGGIINHYASGGPIVPNQIPSDTSQSIVGSDQTDRFNPYGAQSQAGRALSGQAPAQDILQNQNGSKGKSAGSPMAGGIASALPLGVGAFGLFKNWVGGEDHAGTMNNLQQASQGKGTTNTPGNIEQGAINRPSGTGIGIGAGPTQPNTGSFATPPSVTESNGNGASGKSIPGVTVLASNGGKIRKDMRNGGPVAGKAKVKGDSPKNDTVPAMVSPGEVVIPRSVINSRDPAKKSADFVAAILAKKSMGKRK